MLGIFLLLGLWRPAPAASYVLHGEHILKLMAAKMGRTQRLEIEQQVTLFDSRLDQGEITLVEKARFLFPGRFRSDISTDAAKRIHLVSGGRSLTIVDGQRESSSSITLYDRYKDLILYRSRKALAKKLTQQGLDVSVSSFGRLDGKVAYVIGAKYPDESRSQIWVEPETFRPLRWIIWRDNAKPYRIRLEIRYFDWMQKDKIWYPKRIEFYQDGIITRKIVAGIINPNPTFPPNFFDIHRLAARYPAQTKNKANQDAGDVSEIRETIRSFEKIYE